MCAVNELADVPKAKDGASADAGEEELSEEERRTLERLLQREE